MLLKRFAALCAVAVCAAASPAFAQSADDLVGKWGLAAYWKPEDATKARTWAREACGQPYVIGKGTVSGTVMMHIADNPDVQAVKVMGKGNAVTLVPASRDVAGGEAHHTRQLSGWDGKGFEVKWQDSGVASRYGTNVYVRCR